MTDVRMYVEETIVLSSKHVTHPRTSHTSREISDKPTRYARDFIPTENVTALNHRVTMNYD